MIRPITLTGHEVRAVLDGRKTHHCVILKPQPPLGTERFYRTPATAADGNRWVACYPSGIGMANYGRRGPRKQIPVEGDHLYVKEAFQFPAILNSTPPRKVSSMSPVHYIANGGRIDDVDGDDRPLRVRSPVTMPRWASRLTLTVEAVRVFRVQEITEAEAVAEGVRGNAGGAWGCEGLIEDFAGLWNARHGADAWDRNEWVVGLTFTVHRCNVDQME